MSHTLKVIAGGLVLLGLFLLGGRLLSASAPALGMAGAVRWFIPVWLVAAAVNLWIGVTRAGYAVAEEAPAERRPRWPTSRSRDAPRPSRGPCG